MSTNNYVTRDLWDESLKRMESMMTANIAEHKSIADKMRADIAELSRDVNNQISDMRGEVKSLNTRIDQLQHFYYWELAWFSIVLAVIAYFAHS